MNDKENILKQVAKLLSELLQKSQPKEFLTEKEMCEYLDVTRSTLNRWKKKGTIKVYGLEGRIYYHRDEVKNLIINNRIS